jgi:hypothetical protein
VNEQEWARCDDAQSMLELLGERASDRKLRLLSCAYCRARWHWLGNPDQRIVRCVEAVEGFTDGLISASELSAARAGAAVALGESWDAAPGDSYLAGNVRIAEAAVRAAEGSTSWIAGRKTTGGMPAVPLLEALVRLSREEAPGLATLLRDLFGDPVRPVTVHPGWLAYHNGIVPRLAQAAYAERQFPDGTLDYARLALVGDALEDAGCADVWLLGHLRVAGAHVRGCWALDLILSKDPLKQ